MLMFVLGMSLCLNILVFVCLIFIFKLKKREKILKDIVKDENVFSDFFKK